MSTFRRILHLDELADGTLYIASQGEQPKKVAYKLPEKRSMTNLARQKILTHSDIQRVKQKKEKSIFGPSVIKKRIYLKGSTTFAVESFQGVYLLEWTCHSPTHYNGIKLQE
jgi:hypothetical protein